MSEKDTSESFRRLTADFVFNSLFLVCEHLGREASRAFFQKCRDQSRIIHVFDTNVIISACAPWRTASMRTGKFGGYGAILPEFEEVIHRRTSLDPDHEVELARLLAEFALLRSAIGDHGNGVSHGIFQLPVHFVETETIYQYVRNDAARAIQDVSASATRTREEEFAARLAALISSKLQSDDKVENLRLMERMVSFLIQRRIPRGRGEQSVAEWDNFVRLNQKSGGVFGISEAPDILSTDDIPPSIAETTSLKETVPAPEDELEHRLHKIIRTDWKRRLAQFKNKVHDTDSDAIADLFIYNYRLLKQSSSRRLVFVTGDRNLCLASYQKIEVPEEIFRLILEDLGSSSISDPRRVINEYLDNFAYRHVRHLWAYLEEGVLGAGRIAEGLDDAGDRYDEADMDWLHGLLAEWSGRTHFDRQQLVDLLRAVASRRSSRSHLRREFGHTISDLVSEKLEKDEVIDALARFRESLKKNIESNEFARLRRYSGVYPKIERRFQEVKKSSRRLRWNEIVKLVRSDLAHFDDTTVVSLSNIGVSVLFAARSKAKVERNPPPLLFDKFRVPRRIVDALSRSHEVYSHDAFVEDYERIVGEARELSGVVDIEGSGLVNYLKYLVLGALFSSANRWGVANSHAVRAIEIIERDRDTFSNKLSVSGREAYFLAASTKRLIARHVRDYAVAESDLNKAEDAYLNDRSRLKFNAEAMVAHDLRFACERLGLALSRYYFVRSEDPDNPRQEFASAIFDAARKAIEVYEHSRGAHGAPREGDEPLHIDAVIRVSLATNLIQARVVFEYRQLHFGDVDEIEPVGRDWIEASLSTLKNNTRLRIDAVKGDEVKIVKTTLMQCYEIAGKLMLLHRSSDFSGGEIDIGPILEASKNAKIARYDPWRYESLEKFARRLKSEILKRH